MVRLSPAHYHLVWRLILNSECIAETLITPEQFAQLLADDFDSPYAPQFIPLVADEIRRQVQTYGAAAEEDPTGDGNARIRDEEADETDYGEIRIVIKVGREH